MKIVQFILNINLILLSTLNISYANNTGCMDDGYQVWSRNYGSPACNYNSIATIHVQDECLYPDCNGCFPNGCAAMNNENDCIYIGDSGNFKCSHGFYRCSFGLTIYSELDCINNSGTWISDLNSTDGECLYSNEEDCIINNGLWYEYLYNDSTDCVLNEGVWFRDGLDECGICNGTNEANTGICDCLGTPGGNAYYDGCDICVGENTNKSDVFLIEMPEDNLIEKGLFQQNIPVYLSNTGNLNSLFIEMEYDSTYIDIINFNLGSDIVSYDYEIDYNYYIVGENTKINLQFNLYYLPYTSTCNTYNSSTDCVQNIECIWNEGNGICENLQQQILLDCDSDKKEIFQVIIDTKKVFSNIGSDNLISIKKIILNENVVDVNSNWSFGDIYIYNPSKCNIENACNYNDTGFFPYSVDEAECEFPGDVGTEWEEFCNCKGGTFIDDCGNCFEENAPDIQNDGDTNFDGEICEDKDCAGLFLDCNNDCCGFDTDGDGNVDDQSNCAIIDDCGVCVGGNSGKVPSELIVSDDGVLSYTGAYDCKGECHGTAYIDGCNNCIDYLDGDEDCLSGEIKILAQVGTSYTNAFKDILNIDSIFGARWYAFKDTISSFKTFYAAFYLESLPDSLEGLILSINFDENKLDFKGSSLSPYVSGENNDQIYGALSEDSAYTLYSQFTDSTYSSVIYFDNIHEAYKGSSGNMLFLKFDPDTSYVKNLEVYNDTTSITLNYLQVNENLMLESKINSFSKTIRFGDCNGTLSGFQIDTDRDQVCDDIDQCPDEGIDTSSDLRPLESNGCLNTINNLILFPEEYSISQNYPNPFNPITRIQYITPRYSNIKIDIFDIKGNIINTLINTPHQPGQYNVIWDGKNKFGTLVPSGIYFYKIEAEGFRSIKKLVLLK